MMSNQPMLAFFSSLGWPEMAVIGILALLIFGKRLPEVGRSLGKGIVEFKKGLRDTGDDIKAIDSEVRKDVKPTTSATQDKTNTPA